MALDVKLGSKITVTITKSPTNASATKTLARVLAKDPENQRVGRKRQKMLQEAVFYRRRGGRPWANRPKAPALVKPIKGVTCNVTATPDVVNDLASVERFIAVK